MRTIETVSVGVPKINPYFVLRQRVFRWGRAQVALPVAMAVVAPVVLAAAGLAGRVPGVALVVLVLVPAPFLEALDVLRSRREWPAQEVLGWVDWLTLRDWRERVGGQRPRSPAEAQAWLVGHPSTSLPADLRAAMLIVANRLTEADAVIASLPTTTPAECRLRCERELEAAAFGFRPLDTNAADEAVRADEAQSPAEVAACLAYHVALSAVAGGGDGLVELAAARSVVGPLPAELIRRLWLGRLRFAILALFMGAWILVAILVAIATSSGVVLF